MMPSIFEKNIASFKGKKNLLDACIVHSANLECEIEIAKNGSPTARVGLDNKGNYLHSSYNPEVEAQRIVSGCDHNTGLYIVFGFGLGYHVEELLKAAGPTSHIAVLEPNPFCFKKALEVRSLHSALSDRRVFWFFGDDLKNFTYFFDSVFEPLQAGKPQMVMPPAIFQNYEIFFNQALEVVKDTVSRKVVSVNTVYALGSEPEVNTVNNFKLAAQYRGCSTLFNKFKGIPAIIVAAGPSLDKNIMELRRAKGKAVIICVGTALKAMLKAGIEPDFVYSMDPQRVNNYERHFKGVATGKASLLANLQTCTELIKNFSGHVFLTCYNTPVTSLFRDEAAKIGYTFSGGSVATDCLSFAYLTGADPIIMVGQDLSYTHDGRTHAAGTEYGKETINANGKDINQFEIKGNYQEKVLTSRSWYTFLKWFELWISERNDRLYINATEGGAYIAGTQISNLKDVIHKYCTAAIGIEDIINIALSQGPAVKYDDISNKLLEFNKTINKILKNCDKGLDALNKLNKISATKADQQRHHLLKRVRHMYKFLEENELRVLIESLVPGDINTVVAKTHAANRESNDSQQDAIENYIFYLKKIKEGCNVLKNIIDDTDAYNKIEGAV